MCTRNLSSEKHEKKNKDLRDLSFIFSLGNARSSVCRNGQNNKSESLKAESLV